jgi:hypothetical protein
VTSDDGVVELAHEAVARAWPRFRGWLDDDVEGHRILRHLSVAADTWQSMGRPESELYRGARLAQALDWRDRAHPELTISEREYLDASREHEAATLRAAEVQIRRERRTVRRLRALVIGVSALALIAASATWIAADQRDRADDAATIAQARRIGAQALVERGYDRALLFALEGVRRWDTAETRGNLLTTIERSPQAFGVIRTDGPRLLGLDASPDGTRVAVADQADDVTLYDVATRTALATRADDGTSYGVPTFSPDGEQVAVSQFPSECAVGPCSDFARRRDLLLAGRPVPRRGRRVALRGARGQPRNLAGRRAARADDPDQPGGDGRQRVAQSERLAAGFCVPRARRFARLRQRCRPHRRLRRRDRK